MTELRRALDQRRGGGRIKPPARTRIEYSGKEEREKKQELCTLFRPLRINLYSSGWGDETDEKEGLVRASVRACVRAQEKAEVRVRHERGTRGETHTHT